MTSSARSERSRSSLAISSWEEFFFLKAEVEVEVEKKKPERASVNANAPSSLLLSFASSSPFSNPSLTCSFRITPLVRKPCKHSRRSRVGLTAAAGITGARGGSISQILMKFVFFFFSKNVFLLF